MEMNHQKAIFDAMTDPGFYPHPVKQVIERETHISKVFLSGKFAYKIKKPINLEFLDYTTLEKRKHFCHQEVFLNRRLSEGVYLDVTPIILDNDRYSMEGKGLEVEYAVKMRQLSEDATMLNRLRIGMIDSKTIEALAQKLAHFYENTSSGDASGQFGAWETIKADCEENFSQMESCTPALSRSDSFQIIRSATRSFLHRRRTLFKNRVQNHKIRDCHGDLRCDHVYFTDGIQIIDCIEFNERFRYLDVTCDLAFLAMDLDFNGFHDISRELIHTYIELSGDPDLYVLLDFYKCYRAMVRAKVNYFRLLELPPKNPPYLRTER